MDLFFNPKLRANERDHLQKVMEAHYWILGEQYSLDVILSVDAFNAETNCTWDFYLIGQDYDSATAEEAVASLTQAAEQ